MIPFGLNGGVQPLFQVISLLFSCLIRLASLLCSSYIMDPCFLGSSSSSFSASQGVQTIEEPLEDYDGD